MAREVDILSYFPSVLHEIREIIEIANIENPSLESVWQAIEDALNNQFILTANEEGLARYEKMLGIKVPGTDSDETRRFRVLTRYNEQAPYTYKVVRMLLDSLLGEGRYDFIRDTSNKTITVKLELTVKGQFDAVVAMLERVTPQNIVLTIELRYNTHQKLSQFTHSQLASFTHKQLREDVLI